MSRWLVAQGDRQFAARDLEELRELASSGTVASSDMVQPPGTTDWLYAGEIPELKNLFSKDSGPSDVDIDYKRPNLGKPLLYLVLMGIAAGGGWFAFQKKEIVDNATRGIGIALSEMLVIGDAAAVYDKPDGSVLAQLTKDDKVDLLAKRGDWYKVGTKGGMEGYMKVDTVLPGYQLADEETRLDYDPLYNPDQYVTVNNTGWIRLDPSNPENTTLAMLVTNQSKFDMTGMVVLATLKDKNERELQNEEIRVDGKIPAMGDAWVGTFIPPLMERDELDPRIMTNHLAEDLLKTAEYKGWEFKESLTMQVQSLDAVSGKLVLTELTAVPVEDTKE